MSRPNADPVDAIVAVMEQGFDPAFGEAWNRRQVSDALIMSNTHYLLADETGGAPADFGAVGSVVVPVAVGVARSATAE